MTTPYEDFSDEIATQLRYDNEYLRNTQAVWQRIALRAEHVARKAHEKQLSSVLATAEAEALYNLAAAMEAKLAQKSREGYGGFEEMSEASLNQHLWEHLDKGDPVDVANFCAFLLHNRQRLRMPPNPWREVVLNELQLAGEDLTFLMGPSSPRTPTAALKRLRELWRKEDAASVPAPAAAVVAAVDPTTINCPRCSTSHARGSEQHACIALFGECIPCRFLPRGDLNKFGSGQGTAAETQAIQLRAEIYSKGGSLE